MLVNLDLYVFNPSLLVGMSKKLEYLYLTFQYLNDCETNFSIQLFVHLTKLSVNLFLLMISFILYTCFKMYVIFSFTITNIF